MSELWTTDQLAEHLNVHRRRAPTVMKDLGVTPEYRDVGLDGQYRWDPRKVKAALKKRKGQGHRSDLQRKG